MDLNFAKYLINEFIEEWYITGQIDQVDISLLELAFEELD